MPAVKINTSDTAWIERRAIDEPIAYGTDIKGVMHFTATVKVPAVQRVKFAGAAMIRFDLGADFPADHARGGMYPESYLVSE
jgi:hypothetical protein